MKYKYVGKVPAIMLVGKGLKKISPGGEIDVPVAPSPYLINISESKPKSFSKKVKPKKQQEVSRATNTESSSLGK